MNFVSHQVGTPAYAAAHHLSLEEAARTLRYRFLFAQANAYHCQAVAVAHHADDQVETVLMHLLRGAGLDGLTGMESRSLPNAWSDQIPLVRPLLTIWRAEIEAYCRQYGLDPIQDHTNSDPTFFRNRLRHELIPTLETYAPKFRQRLFQTADLLTADQVLLQTLTITAWQETVVEEQRQFISLWVSNLRSQPVALQRRLLRKALAHLCPGGRDLDFAMVQRATNLIANPTASGQIDLGLGLRAFIEADLLFLADWEADLPANHWPQLASSQTFSLSEFSRPGKFDLGCGWVLQTELLLASPEIKAIARHNRDPYRVWVDPGGQPAVLTVRSRQPGDRWQPLGMRGQSIKLSDFMINVKMAQRARAGWPLVCIGDDVVWVPGYRLSHAYRLTDITTQVLQLSLQKAE